MISACVGGTNLAVDAIFPGGEEGVIKDRSDN
jgi:hypothetical protein